MRHTLLFLLFCQTLTASDWLCREVASERHETDIVACGIGTGDTEPDARENALERAQVEFKRVCELSSDCLHHDYTLYPMRSECERTENGYKCYRAIRYEISPEVRRGAEPPEVPVAQPASDAPVIERSPARYYEPRGAELILGVQAGGQSPTSQSGYATGFMSVGLSTELKYGRIGLRVGAELDTNGTNTSDPGTIQMGGWQTQASLPLYLVNGQRSTLSIFPQVRYLDQDYFLSTSGGNQTLLKLRQVGLGGGFEYRYALSDRRPGLALVFGAAGTSYSGTLSVSGSAGIAFGF